MKEKKQMIKRRRSLVDLKTSISRLRPQQRFSINTKELLPSCLSQTTSSGYQTLNKVLETSSSDYLKSLLTDEHVNVKYFIRSVSWTVSLNLMVKRSGRRGAEDVEGTKTPREDHYMLAFSIILLTCKFRMQCTFLVAR